MTSPPDQDLKKTGGAGPRKTGFAMLRNRSEFLALRDAPRHQSNAFMIQGRLEPCGRSGEGQLKVGFTVTRRTGNAVIRNRIRRRLRHALQSALQTLRERGTDPCGEIVFVARPPALGLPFPALAELITKGIDRMVAKGNKAVEKRI